MFALGIEFMTGSVVAAQRDRNTPEWPPHPARLFMAMVAAHHANEPHSEPESDALKWLEGLPPPAIVASGAHVRFGWDRSGPLDPVEIASSVDDVGPMAAAVYVPANDRASGKGTLQSAPGLSRKKGERRFPAVRPRDERVFIVWATPVPAHHRAALEAICGKVTRIGHSSSLVRVWVEDDPPSPTWLPTSEQAEIHLRVPTSGYLLSLEQSYRRDATRLPDGAVPHGYAPAARGPAVEVPGSVWDPDLAVLGVEPLESPFRHLDLISTLGLTAGIHRAVVALVPDPVPEFVSGHDAAGNASSAPHLAYFPLGWVGDAYADGLIRGFAVALPRGLDRSDRRVVYRTLGRMRELRLGRLGRWRIVLGDPDSMPIVLQPWAWTGARAGRRRWGSVTPMAFDKHAKGQGEAYRSAVSAMVSDACVNAGLPEPAVVRIGPVSAHTRAPASHEFPRIKRKDGSQRRHLHVEVEFEKPVRGPVILGAGRYRGYGLLRPVRERRPQGVER